MAACSSFCGIINPKRDSYMCRRFAALLQFVATAALTAERDLGAANHRLAHQSALTIGSHANSFPSYVDSSDGVDRPIRPGISSAIVDDREESAWQSSTGL